MGWKDIPMPPRVAALPRDKRGFPVPWISEWHHPDEEGLVIEEDHPVHGAWASSCSHVDGRGEPKLGALCPSRQVQGMIDRLCDVCGEQVGEVALFMGGKPLAHGRGDGYAELPLHLECALYSGQVCPGLVTPAADQVWVSACREYALRPQRKFISGDRTFNGLEDQTWRILEGFLGISVLIGVFGVPIDRDTWPLETFLAMHGVQSLRAAAAR